jgi:hypothetical protein
MKSSKLLLNTAMQLPFPTTWNTSSNRSTKLLKILILRPALTSSRRAF